MQERLQKNITTDILSRLVPCDVLKKYERILPLMFLNLVSCDVFPKKKINEKKKKSEEIAKKKDNSSKTDLGIDIRPRTLYEENLLNPWYSILLVGKPPYL